MTLRADVLQLFPPGRCSFSSCAWVEILPRPVAIPLGPGNACWKNLVNPRMSRKASAPIHNLKICTDQRRKLACVPSAVRGRRPQTPNFVSDMPHSAQKRPGVRSRRGKNWFAPKKVIGGSKTELWWLRAGTAGFCPQTVFPPKKFLFRFQNLEN